MDYGLVLPAGVQGVDDVVRAEQRGFTHAWLYDSQMLFSDVYATLALCATRTERIALGPGVTNPASRIAPVTACAMATVNALAPGRAILGIGTGNTARRTLGMPAARLSQLRAHIEICRELFAGRTTDYREGDRLRKIRFLNPKGGWIDLEHPIPIYVAASGPKSLELAGEIGDGVILFGTVSPSLIEFAMNHVRRGAEKAGRRVEDLYVLCMTAFYLTEPGQPLESSEVRQAVGPFVSSSSNIFAYSCPDPADLPADLRDDIVAFKGAYQESGAPIESRHLTLYSDYLQGFKKEHEPLVTEKVIRATTLTGTPAEVREAIDRMRAAGIRQVAIQPILDPQRTIESFAQCVIDGARS